MSVDTVDDVRMATRKELGPLPRFLRPFVDWVARIRATVHTKLLAGFLLIALLLLSMGTLSIVVLGRLNQQVETLTALNRQASQARDMIYEVTSQSHYRAMALLQLQDDSWTPKIYVAKDLFANNLSDMRTSGAPSEASLLDTIDSQNVRYGASSESVTGLFEAGRYKDALALHIDQEHAISHELEASLNTLITDSQALVVSETDSFEAHRRFLTIAVATFSGVSLLVAMTLGAILSWSLIRPVRRVDEALERIADGDFDGVVEVPNRDEFGNLTRNLNRTTGQLATLYGELNTLNANLQETVDTKVAEIERVSRLKRYLSPGLAESIVSGTQDVTLGSSRRKFLTTFFSDVRGFTAAAERMEPEELVSELNDYFSEMTEIVFKHGGTLDKYVGDAVMVFFGDPIPQDDHAERALRMALEMLGRMRELEDHWFRRYDEVFKIGIGITTGWVTVGDIGSPARSDYTVLGNQVNLASRLADKAEPGQILVTERTMVAVDHMVDGRLVDQITLKGISRPIKIYEILPPVAPQS